MSRYFMPPSSASLNRRGFLAATGALTLAATLSACGGGDDTSGSTSAKKVTQADIDKAMKTPTELTFWTWVPNIDKEIALFQKKYPAIKVKAVNAGQGVAHYTKLRTALKAGSGAPDAVQIEYQAIPTFTITDSLLNLSPYGAAALKSTFVDWTWGQVSGPNGEIWAIPQDTGPMGMLYRKDIFDKHGIEVPETWDDFAVAARELHKADPKVHLTNLAGNEAAAWHGLLWQAGAKPYATSGKSEVTIDVDGSVSRKLGEFWGGLAKEGVIGTEPDFADSWYAALNKGKYATWITAAWGPAFLSGSAKSTAGKWRAAPLPQWDVRRPERGRRTLGPGLVTVLLFTLVATWNNYFLPLIMLNDPDLYPITVGLSSWAAQAQNGGAGASSDMLALVVTGSLISIIPLVAAFLLLQRYWQSGLASGGVKQ